MEFRLKNNLVRMIKCNFGELILRSKLKVPDPKPPDLGLGGGAHY